MPSASPNPSSTTARSLTETRWSESKQSKNKKIVAIAQDRGLALKVLIADRDSMASDLLVLALASDGRYEATAVHASELRHAVSKSEVDLVIIGPDPNMNTGSGLQVLEALHHSDPDLKIIVLIDDPSSDAVLNSFQAGARGVFCRRQPIAEFLDCVEHVGNGCIWAGIKETNQILAALKTIPRVSTVSGEDLPQLSTRELEVVRHAARGKTNKVIASELGLSEHTVKNYLFRAFSKVGVSSRVELLFHLASRVDARGAIVEKSSEASVL